MKKRMIAAAALVFSLFCVSAETKIGAEISLNSGWMHLDSPLLKEKNFWYSSGNAKLKVDTALFSAVKAYIEGGVSVSSVPELVNPVTGETVLPAAVTEWSLNKAYLKWRLPWGIAGSRMGISAGKMPLSWGYGLFYNAGDLIFGGDPMNSAGELSASSASGMSFTAASLSDFRTSTEWIFALSVPVPAGIQLEAVALPPFGTAGTSAYGRFGGRAMMNTGAGFLENFECGWLSDGDMAVQKAYLALDGTLWLDYNLNSCAVFTKDDGFDRDGWQISASLSKILNIQTDVQNHQLQLRAEALWSPLAERLGVFGFASYQITDSVSVSGTYIFCGLDGAKIVDNAHFAGVTFGWEPLKALEISVQGMVNCAEPDKLASVTAGIRWRY